LKRLGDSLGCKNCCANSDVLSYLLTYCYGQVTGNHGGPHAVILHASTLSRRRTTHDEGMSPVLISRSDITERTYMYVVCGLFPSRVSLPSLSAGFTPWDVAEIVRRKLV